MSNVTTDSLAFFTISDFTPGIVRYGNKSVPSTYAPLAPVGSAAYAYRCIAKQGVGLVPQRGYSVNNSIHVSVGAVGSAVNEWYPITLFENGSNGLALVYGGWDGSSHPRTTIRDAIDGNFYTTAGSATGSFIQGSNLTYWFDGTNVQGVVYDLAQAANTWVTFPIGTGTVTTFVSGAFNPTLLGFFTSRIVAVGFGDTVYYGGINSLPSAGFTAEYFNPEMGTNPYVIGSISTGEMILIYAGGGGVIVSGDVGSPSSAITLPGVTSADVPFHLGIPTPIGLLYGTTFDGIYVWNGGNTSQKISGNIPDNVCVTPNVGTGIVVPYQGTAWGSLVYLPNNWIFDTTTGSWWMSENPATVTFAQFARSRGFFNGIYAVNYGSASGTSFLQGYNFSTTYVTSSWEWQSNPIPQSVGNLTSIQAVEIVASNPTATSATIVVTPKAPAGQTPFTNQNATQSVTFTIPPTTTGWRSMLSLGYTDYNVELNVVASNSNNANSAPVLHSLSVGTSPRSSRAQ